MTFQELNSKSNKESLKKLIAADNPDIDITLIAIENANKDVCLSVIVPSGRFNYSNFDVISGSCESRRFKLRLKVGYLSQLLNQL